MKSSMLRQPDHKYCHHSNTETVIHSFQVNSINTSACSYCQPSIVTNLTFFCSQVLTVERMVFDTFGQMWGTMILNCMTALCTLTGIVGVCINEKMAIGVVSGNNALLYFHCVSAIQCIHKSLWMSTAVSINIWCVCWAH